jgi:hypothetical protein
MTELPRTALVPAQAPIGRMAALGLGRIALAGCLLALAALLVTTTGGGGLRGALGSLFGFHAGHAPRSATAHRRSQPRADRAVPFQLLPISRGNARAPVARRHARGHRRDASHQRQTPGRPPAPSTSPVPQIPPAPPAAPAPPGSQGLVGSAAHAIDQAAPVLPPPAQPLVHEAVATVGQLCGLLGQCP